MNIKDIQEKVEAINADQKDYERAHALEDALYLEFVKHVAQAENPKLRALALEVLKTKDIKFARMTA